MAMRNIAAAGIPSWTHATKPSHWEALIKISILICLILMIFYALMFQFRSGFHQSVEWKMWDHEGGRINSRCSRAEKDIIAGWMFNSCNRWATSKWMENTILRRPLESPLRTKQFVADPGSATTKLSTYTCRNYETALFTSSCFARERKLVF